MSPQAAPVEKRLLSFDRHDGVVSNKTSADDSAIHDPIIRIDRKADPAMTPRIEEKKDKRIRTSIPCKRKTFSGAARFRRFSDEPVYEEKYQAPQTFSPRTRYRFRLKRSEGLVQ
jgi:hypothetical protein